MADETAVEDNANAATLLLGVTGTLYAVALLLFSARIHTIFRQRQLGWDDLTATCALAFAIVEWSLIAAAAQNGLGQHDANILPQNQAMVRHLVFASISLWTVCIMFIRTSIACTLLRLKQSRSWRLFLWILITVQILSCFASLIFQNLQCNPTAYIWSPITHPTAVCVKPSTEQANMYIHTGIGTSTDFILSLSPISFLWQTRRPLREIIALWFLVSIGLFATASSIVKMLRSTPAFQTTDFLYTTTPAILWSLLEQQSGLIAACIPALEPFVDRLVQQWHGIPTIAHPEDHHTDALKLRTTRSDTKHPPFRRLSLTPTPPPFTLNLILPNPSTTTTSSILQHYGQEHSLKDDAPMQSSTTVWPTGSDGNHGDRDDDAYEHMLVGGGGILMTTEFQVRSEGVSRVGSPDGDLEKERQRVLEEWRVERPSEELRIRGWDGV